MQLQELGRVFDFDSDSPTKLDGKMSKIMLCCYRCATKLSTRLCYW